MPHTQDPDQGRRRGREREQDQEEERERQRDPNRPADGEQDTPHRDAGSLIEHLPNYESEVDLTDEPDYLYNTQPFYSGEAGAVGGPPDEFEPQGRRRSDEDLGYLVRDRLAAQRDLDARQIEVQVHNHRVTLRGRVPDAGSKELAEQVAGVVAGVTGIDNELRVDHEEGKLR